MVLVLQFGQKNILNEGGRSSRRTHTGRGSPIELRISFPPTRAGRVNYDHKTAVRVSSAGLKQTAPLPMPGSAQGFFLLVREFFLATVVLGLL